MEAVATTSMVFLAVAARHCDHGAQTKMGLQTLLVTILVLRAKTVAFCSFCSPSASRWVYTGSIEGSDFASRTDAGCSPIAISNQQNQHQNQEQKSNTFAPAH